MRISFERCWVIGAGAVGSVMAAAVHLQGKLQTFLVGRSPHARAIKENGLAFEIQGGTTHKVRIAIVSPEELPCLAAGDLVLLTQKIHGLQAAADWLRPGCKGASGIIALQNGIGLDDMLTAAVGRSVDRGLAFLGANSPEPGYVRYFPGRLRLCLSEVTTFLTDFMQGSYVPCKLSADFQKTQWLKLAINCVANPLAGILGVGNFSIGHSTLDTVKTAILQEVCDVAQAEGVDISVTAEDINRYLDQDNTPSLQADLKRKDPTEIYFINGAVVRMGAKHGIATPVNSALVSMVTFLESQ